MKEDAKIENSPDEFECEIVAIGIAKVRYAEQKVQTHCKHARETGKDQKFDKHEYVLAIDEARLGVVTGTAQAHHGTRSLPSIIIISFSHNRARRVLRWRRDNIVGIALWPPQDKKHDAEQVDESGEKRDVEDEQRRENLDVGAVGAAAHVAHGREEIDAESERIGHDGGRKTARGQSVVGEEQLHRVDGVGEAFESVAGRFERGQVKQRVVEEDRQIAPERLHAQDVEDETVGHAEVVGLDEALDGGGERDELEVENGERVECEYVEFDADELEPAAVDESEAGRVQNGHRDEQGDQRERAREERLLVRQDLKVGRSRRACR